LAQDSSIFESTFSLPDHSETTSSGPEGTCDENPFILHGETAQRFRLLLLALYGLPSEIIKLFSPDGDFLQLVDIASISHKYSFKDIEAVTVALLTAKLQKSQHPIGFDFLPLLDYAVISDKISLRDETLKIVRELVVKDDIDFIRVICFAEGRNDKCWKSLLGLALYYYVVKGPVRWNLNRYRDHLPKSTGILLHISYATLADMRESGVPWEHTCGNAVQCALDWLKFLGVVTRSYSFSSGPADFVSWVRTVVQNHSSSYTPCQKVAMSRYQAEASALESGSWEFFEKLQW